MVKALIHRYDNELDILAVEKNRCSDVFKSIKDDDFELVVVVPTKAANTDIAIVAEALSKQYALDVPTTWPGRPDRYATRVDVGIVKQINVVTIRQAFEEANLIWAAAWTVYNASLPDWVRDLLDSDMDTPSVVREGASSYRTGEPSAGENDGEESSALEGLLREQTSYTRTRDRRLRNQAIARSKGICEVCEVDFSKILDGRGVRALQVHHRNQLSLNDLPVITKLSDLAVVCANCHAMIHMNRNEALSVEKLKQLLN